MALGELIGDIVARQRPGRPIIVALDGPVAGGKSTLARALAEALPRAAMISADGFLLPLARLQLRGLITRKGFPESFDREAMIAFLTAVRADGSPDAPAYAHDLYDVSPVQRQATAGAGIVIFEGVNVLQSDLAPLYDLSLYLDADQSDLERWFTRRFVETPLIASRAAALAPWRPIDGDPAAWAAAVWAGVNLPNLEQHIAPGRARADMVIRKAADYGLSIG